MCVISDYTKLEEGDLYSDNILGYLWKVCGKTRKGAILRNVLSKTNMGVRIVAELETTTFQFFPLEARIHFMDTV
ncbi:MAG: hypothetical protein IJT16_00130 [Lachnospiraceae bacterium]|nr:hypothetical protein [Lachnospiraceae bacterium]